MQKLPKIYHVENKRPSTNKEMCVVEEVANRSTTSVEETLKKVYAGLGSKYNTNIIIETKDNVYNTSLIYKSKDELITKENATIKVKDIINITIKK